MTELDKMIATAFASQGKQEDINKVYLAFLHTSLFIPVKKEKALNSEEPFSPLFAHIENQFYVLAFDTIERLSMWAGDHFNEISYVEISGQDLVIGLNEQVYLCLNLGTDFYKEFAPDEVIHLKKIVARIAQLKNL